MDFKFDKKIITVSSCGFIVLASFLILNFTLKSLNAQALLLNSTIEKYKNTINKLSAGPAIKDKNIKEKFEKYQKNLPGNIDQFSKLINFNPQPQLLQSAPKTEIPKTQEVIEKKQTNENINYKVTGIVSVNNAYKVFIDNIFNNKHYYLGEGEGQDNIFVNKINKTQVELTIDGRGQELGVRS